MIQMDFMYRPLLQFIIIWSIIPVELDSISNDTSKDI